MSGFVHSVFHLSPKVEIQILQLFKDNYCYFIHNKASEAVVVVDPADSEVVSKFISHNHFQNSFKAILTTHHHADHSGGNEELAKRFPSIQVYGGDSRIPAMTHETKDREILKVGGLSIEVLFTPCHTSGHVCYYLNDQDQDQGQGALFTGDTMFIGGCGRFFEGSADQMIKALTLLTSFPDSTYVFCGHEYTHSNLLFALEVEPDNQYLKEKEQIVRLQREKHQFTVPSTIGEEKKINPFVRIDQNTIAASVGLDHDSQPTQRMKLLRQKKDSWKSPL